MRMGTFLSTTLLCSSVVFIYAACSSQPIQQTGEEALYYRMGARKELGKIVIDAVDSWTTDPRLLQNSAIKEKTQKADLNVIKRSLFSFTCWATQGPCTFKEESLADLKDIRISQMEWFYMLEAVVTAMGKHSVPMAEQNEFMALLDSLRPKVVDRPL